jgi:hypothetical protein
MTALLADRRGLVAAALIAALGAVEPPPPLAVPAPPARIIVPPDPTPPPRVEETPAPASPVRPRPTRPATPTRQDPKAEPAARAEPEAKPGNGQETPSVTPAPTLEMPPGDRGDGAVRHQLTKAQDDLKRVDYAALSNDLKAQYETAKRFITLGEQALREQNLIFAATLAEKAGAIATLLLRR